MRLLLLLLLGGLLAAVPAQAQTLCQGGSAGGFPCDDVDLLANLPRSTFGTTGMNDIWGWTDPQTGNEYALVGYRSGTAFVDVTTPTAPVYLGSLPTATGNSTWRDIKTYGTYAFIVSEASNHGMQVFDLTRLRNVSNPPQTFTADTRYTGFGSAHNIVIDDQSGFAYAVGSDRCSGGLEMVNIQNPLSPSDAGCYSGDGYTHDAQCLVYNGPDTDYTGRQLCFASNEDTVTIVDVTNKSNPVQISRSFYPNDGYTHQGWLTEDQRYFLVDDELDELFGGTSNTRTIVFDMTDLDSPEVDFFYFGPLQTSDHNLYVNGRYAYLSNYEGGLRIVDLDAISRGTITEVASFDTYPASNAAGFSGQWSNYPFFASGTVIANDQENGLFVLRPNLSSTQPPVTAAITPTGSTSLPASGGAIAYDVSLTNTTSQSQTFDAWIVAILPSGSEFGTIEGPQAVTLSPNQVLGPIGFSESVPAAAPSGTYAIELRTGDFPATVDASAQFTFDKSTSTRAAAQAAGGSVSAYPNPFNPSTALTFTLADAADVRLAVLDALGREVAVLAEGRYAAGAHEARFDAGDLPSGLYLVRLDAGGHTDTQRITLMK